MSIPTDNDINDAIRRIALSPDGALLYRRLQIELMAVPTTTDSGALQSSHGRRSLARELKLLMDEELSKVTSERDRRGEHDPDAPAITRRADTISVARPGTGRRVADDDKPA